MDVAVVEGALRLEPPVVHPGEVYLVLSESADSLTFIYRSADPDDPLSQPLPVTDDDIRSVQRTGSFHGATLVSLAVGGHGNVFRIGHLAEGRYVLLRDRSAQAPMSAERFTPAILEVRD